MKMKTWVEVSKSALISNLNAIKRLVGPAKVMAVVKSNAYGHGLVQTAKAIRGTADWFGVDNVDEALVLRKAGTAKPILILGHIPFERIKEAVKHGISFVAYRMDAIKAAANAGTKKRQARVHLKLETGLTRQGIASQDLPTLAHVIKKFEPMIRVEGVSTHFANIEDTNDAAYAHEQLSRFLEAIAVLREHGIDPPWKHTACSAAALLFPETHFNLVRLGISLYGLWSSERTERDARKLKLRLHPAMTWKTIVAQVKRVPKGTPVGYGLTERVVRDSLIAVLPIGYWDGYDRGGLSGKAHVLIRGKRCKILGRICMNMCMADATGVPGVRPDDEAVLLGRQGREEIRADELAGLIGTINYEVIARINPLISRILV